MEANSESSQRYIATFIEAAIHGTMDSLINAFDTAEITIAVSASEVKRRFSPAFAPPFILDCDRPYKPFQFLLLL